MPQWFLQTSLLRGILDSCIHGSRTMLFNGLADSPVHVPKLVCHENCFPISRKTDVRRFLRGFPGNRFSSGVVRLNSKRYLSATMHKSSKLQTRMILLLEATTRRLHDSSTAAATGIPAFEIFSACSGTSMVERMTEPDLIWTFSLSMSCAIQKMRRHTMNQEHGFGHWRPRLRPGHC